MRVRRLVVKVIEYLQRSNEKRSVNIQRMLELKQYYISMYHFYLLKMYEKGYTSDPTVFNTKEVIQNILDLKIKGLFDITGSVKLEEDWVKYAIAKNKENAESKEFLDLLYLTIKYKEYNKDLDMFYEEYNKSVSLRLILVGSKIVSKSGLNLSKGSLQCLIPSGKKLSILNIKHDLWNISMKVLGIPESDWYTDGLFDNALTHEEEVDSIFVLLEGSVSTKGKYTSLLEEWLFKHKWSSDGLLSSKQGLLSYIFSSKSSDVFDALTIKANSVPNENVLTIIRENVYIIEDIENYKVPISYFAISTGYEDNVVTTSNYLYGYTGEAYEKSFLEEEGINFIGLPVKIVLEDMNECYVYDREQVDIKSNTWFSENDLEFYFDTMELKNKFKEEDSLHHSLHNIFVEAQNGVLGVLNAKEYSLKEIETGKNKVTKALIKQLGV